jgi:hypothetical protein
MLQPAQIQAFFGRLLKLILGLVVQGDFMAKIDGRRPPGC